MSFLRLLIPAGAETTFRLIGNMLFALLTERDRWERVRADRSLVPWVIEETLRWETSVLMVSRQTNREVGDPRRHDPRRSARVDRRRLGQPRRGPLRATRTSSTSTGAPTTTWRSASAAITASAITSHASRRGWRSTRVLDRLPNLRLDPSAPAPTITGLAFRSPKTLRALAS